MLRITTIALPFTLALLSACGPDETISGQLDPTARYTLTAMENPTTPNDTLLPNATIQFPEEGAFTGDGPCNRYWGAQTVPYPWIAFGPIATTRRACPDLRAEATYLQLLSQMTFAEVAGDVLLLSNDQDATLTFVRQSD